MRYRVDLEGSGYISYDESDRDKAYEIYHERGVRIRLCSDIYDEGTVIEGEPVFCDLSRDYYNEN